MFSQYLLVFLIAMVPVAELRLAVPIAVKMGLDVPLAFMLILIGNMLPVPLIYLFSRRVLEWGLNFKKWPWFRKFCNFCLVKGEKTGEKLSKKGKAGVYVALMLFVGIPVPGTGAWTETLAASILKLDFRKTVMAVLAGVLMAGLIMALGSFGVKGLF